MIVDGKRYSPKLLDSEIGLGTLMMTTPTPEDKAAIKDIIKSLSGSGIEIDEELDAAGIVIINVPPEYTSQWQQALSDLLPSLYVGFNHVYRLNPVISE